MINNGYAVVLNEIGKQYVDQQVQLNLQSIDTSSQAIIEQAKVEINKFIEQQEQVIKNLEAATGRTLKEILSTRSTDSLGITMFEDQKESLAASQDEYEARIKVIKDSANHYYNVMHKTIHNFSQILKISSSTQTATSHLENEIKKLEGSVLELEKEEAKFFTSLLEQIQNSNLTLEELNKQYDKVWRAYSKHVPINVSKSGANGNYQITTPNLSNDIRKAVLDMMDALKTMGVQDTKDLNKFLKINKRYSAGESAAKKARQAYDKLRNIYAEYIGGTTKSLYHQSKAREAIYSFLCDYIESQSKPSTELQLFADTSRGDITRKQANAAELTISSHSQRELSNLIPDMVVRSKHLGDQQTRSITAELTLTKYKEQRMRKSGIDINDLQNLQKESKLFKEFGSQKVYDKVDDYLSIMDKDEKNEYIIAFSDKLYQAYSDTKHGLENIGIVASDGANLLSSLDLLTSEGDFTFSQNITNQLLFTLLNISSASIYYDTAKDYRTQISKFIDDLLTAYFTNLAFNTSNFAAQLPSTTASRQILYVTQADNIIVPLSTSLKGILKQLSSENEMRNIVNVQITPDIEHDSDSLYNASLQRFPVNGNLDMNQAARWNYVAQQVAHNTLIKVSYNILALAQYYKA